MKITIPKFWAREAPPEPRVLAPQTYPVISVDDLPNASGVSIANKPTRYTVWDGDKFDGSFGITDLNWTDYWMLRQRSIQLFTENLYAYGTVNRLVTAIINTGLFLEATPAQELLGKTEDFIEDWSEMVENRFDLWAEDPKLCDYNKKSDFGQIQRIAYLTALIEGDTLCVMRIDPKTKMPAIQLIDANSVENPANTEEIVRSGHTVEWGVELNARKQHVAYWVRQEDGSSKRLPAFGRNGRRMAWLVYGIDPGIDQVRGKPLLSIILQSLKEIDRYRDSAQRKATINSLLAMYIQKDADMPGTIPLQGAATRVGTIQGDIGGPPVDRSVQWVDNHPGMVFQELQKGEKPVAHQNNGEIHYPVFEDAIIQACAWALNIPPEILKLSFNSNYSASQAANAEFRIYTDQARKTFGVQFCKPIYEEFMLSEISLRKQTDPGIMAAWNDPTKRDVYNMWMQSDWAGSVKPSADIVKTAKGYTALIEQGLITRTLATREITGRKFSRNAKALRRENEKVADFRAPILESEAKIAAEAQPEPQESEVSENGED